MGMRCVVLLASVVFLATADSVGHAQAIRDEPPIGAPILAGAGLGIAGFGAGGLAGLALSSNCSGEYCGLEAAFYGAAVGGTLGLATGVWLGNRQRGSLPLDFVTGAAIWSAGIGGVALSSNNESTIHFMFVAVPIVQLAATVAVERAVGRARASRQGTRMSLLPTPRGGMLLLVTVPIR